ncbi:hypothetical protein PV04_05594 [Phialophora macrospora]|uniref:Zn(2)-C6 fungal-type domain-containing protein n=1 Tax=Phialophora macrospora TaxID=1851006 RepID=A0A0D2CX38_9EURO|nr:hypothetical protein PV04_05594 [Phialophora macrospora]
MGNQTKSPSSRSHTLRACLECRRTQSNCDGARPVCGICLHEKGLSRCWLRSPRRRRQVNGNLAAGGAVVPGDGVLQSTESIHAAGDGRDQQSPRQNISTASPQTYASSPRRLRKTAAPPSRGNFEDRNPADGQSGVDTDRSNVRNDTFQIPHSTAMHLIHLFFEKIQPWMPMFHRPGFLKFCGQRLNACDEDALRGLDLEERLLFLAIFAMSARFSTSNATSETKAPDRGERFATLAKKTYDVARDELEPSLTFLQGCVLLAFYYYTSGLCAQGWVIVGVCARMSYALGLHEIDGAEHDGDGDPTALEWDPIEVERRRRTWWLVWELDCFGSTVLQRPFAIDQRRWAVRLPMSDGAWFGGRLEHCELLTWEPGQIWRALVGMGSHDERACFLVANVLLSLVVDRCQQKKGIALEEKITLENDVNCVLLALPPAFDLTTQSPMFDNTSFGRCNWIIGTHLLLAASACLAAGIKVWDGSSPQLQSNGLNHMLRLATVIRNWSPDYISLAHPFLAYALAPILGSEPPSVRSSPPYPSFYNLATLVQRRFAEKWKVGDIAIDIGALREKTDTAPSETCPDLRDSDLTKQYPLYFSSFYKPHDPASPDDEALSKDCRPSTCSTQALAVVAPYSSLLDCSYTT